MTEYQVLTQTIETAAKEQKTAFETEDDPGYWLASLKLIRAFCYRNGLDGKSHADDQRVCEDLLFRLIATECHQPRSWQKELLSYFSRFGRKPRGKKITIIVVKRKDNDS